MKIKILSVLILILIFCSGLYSKGNPYLNENSGDNNNHQYPPLPTRVVAQVSLVGNNIKAYMWNTGVFNQNLANNNNPGLEWPALTGHFAWFTSGLSIGCYIGSDLRLATASYKGELSAGYVSNGVFTTDSRFRLYKISAAYPQGNNDPNSDKTFDSWADYAQMIPFGAPYVDVNNNGVYDAGVDVPGIKDAATTVFCCMTDADPNGHSNSEGFSGGTAPIKEELHFTSWEYNGPGLTDMFFVRWVVINKNNVPWNNTYFGIVNDPDLGFSDDDYVGCDLDTSGGGKQHNMGYVYNADNNDDGNSFGYGISPPACGQDFFLSPIIPTGNQADTVVIYDPPGSNHRVVKRGFKELGLTSFNFFTNPSTPGGTCERDPSFPTQAYNYLKGYKSDGTPLLDPTQTPPTQTKFSYPGDPESLTGWTEYAGNIRNCGGVLTGTPIVPSPPGDRRFIFNSGSETFVVNPNDTQTIVLGQLIARGSSNVNSVTKLKTVDIVAQKIFDLNFHVIPPPPVPKVNVSVNPNSDVGTCNIVLSWGDTSETYHYYDNLYNTGFYDFQGYEVYEVKKNATSLPDPLDPASMNDDITLLKIYDLKDSVGVITDTLSNGIGKALFPVVPPYRTVAPAGFPNSGITRNINLSRTAYTSLNGNVDRFVYGNTYKFLVVAYGYNRNGVSGGKVIRNAFTTAVITVTPEAPPAGTTYTMKNGDTLNTNRRDLGVIPVIMAQEQVKTATYRIIFGAPDTSYSILKAVNNGPFTTLKTGLKTVPYRPIAEDSSKIIDGVLFQVNKIRYRQNSIFDFQGNVGIISDFTSSIAPDSTQSRYHGWDYKGGTRNVEGSKFYLNGLAYQSVSMGLSWPNANTYNGLISTITPEKTRKIKIKFTGEGNGQTAYRWAGTPDGDPYLDSRPVPFKVYEVSGDDGTSNERQVNVGFLEFPDSVGGHMDGKFAPTSDSTGGKDILLIFASDYDPNSSYYPTLDMLADQTSSDLMFVWSPKLISSQSPFYTVNDELTIYPYTVTRPEIAPGFPLYYDVNTVAPIVGNSSVATQNADMNRITVVPNPYYGFNNLESSSSGRFVTFRRLPINCTIKIYTLNGDLIRKLEKNDQNSTLRWDMNNFDGVPIASGVYIALIDAPGIGDKVVKLAIFTPQERIDF